MVPPATIYFPHASLTLLESNTVLWIPVHRSHGIGTASVSYATVEGTARGTTALHSGDFRPGSGRVTFLDGQSRAELPVALFDDLVFRGPRFFQVQLSDPSPGWDLSVPATIPLWIDDNDPSGTAQSVVDVTPPEPPPDTGGSLTLTLTPPEVSGKWRFVWDTDWRASGETARGLVPGNYPVEFLARSNYVAPPPTVYPVGPGVKVTGSHHYFLTAASHQAGGLKVNLRPPEIIAPDDLEERGQWRLQGDPQWLDSGSIQTGVPAGVHFIEFKPVPGHLTPPLRSVQIVHGQIAVIEGVYLIAPHRSGISPQPLADFEQVTDGLEAGLPYAFNGQLLADGRYGSGFVVQKRAVLTSAHLLFHAATLSHATNVQWFFQRHRDRHEPVPQTPRGWYLFEGYAAARDRDLNVLGLGPDESSAESFNLDVAALYFFEDAGRGGSGGYLVSDPPSSSPLLLPQPKLFLGYPANETPKPNTHILHHAGPDDFYFEHLRDGLYGTRDVKIQRGASGGPICVEAVDTQGRRYFAPAAIYLGGDGESIFRVIDSDVIDLMSRSTSVTTGTSSNSSFGIIHVVGATSPNGNTCLSVVEVELGPASAVMAGGAWRMVTTNILYSNFTNYNTFSRRIPIGSESVQIEMRPVPGFNLPSNQTFRVICDQDLLVLAHYTVVPPRLGFQSSAPGQVSLTMTGTPHTAYRIEQAGTLSGVPPWTLLMNRTLSNGINILMEPIPSTPTQRFYRAVWIP